MFFGRKKELANLEKMYQSNKFECAIVYGRRRIGKTTLINEFIKDKKTIYFQAQQTNEKMNLQLFSQSVYHTFQDSRYLPPFENFVSALHYIRELAEQEKLVLFIDEYPYLAESVPGISSILQEFIDRYFSNQPNLMIILCGSSISFMENQVLGYQSPLYGRRTGQFKINPLSIWETKEMLPGFSNQDLFAAHSITGGIPAYLAYMDDQESIKDNILHQFLDPNQFLFQEPTNLLLQELREPARYDAILQSIAQGASKRNEISTKTNIPNGTIGSYLNTLMDLNIIKKVTPLFQKEGRKSIYVISDSFFYFWYRFISRNLNLIERQTPEIAWENIDPYLSDWLGSCFETLCYEWCFKAYKQLPFTFQDIGRWWGNNPIEKRQEEIDLIAYKDHQALFMECKYRNTISIEKVHKELIRKSHLFTQFDQMYYLIFTKYPIDETSNHLKTISLDDILSSSAV